MNGLRKLFITVCVVASAVAFSDTPRVLIVPQSQDEHGGTATNYDIADAVADSFERGGQVKPIVFSETDPIFRQAINNGELSTPTKEISADDVQKAFTDLKCAYVIYVTCFNVSGQVFSKAKLTDGNSMIWQDPVPPNLSASAYKKLTREQKLLTQYGSQMVGNGAQIDPDLTTRTIADGWRVKLSETIWKSLPSHTPITVQPTQVGQVPLVQNVGPTVKKQSDDLLFKSIDDATSAGKNSLALKLARDGVDEDPFDQARRQRLITLLRSLKMDDLASGEASSAAALMSNGASLYVSSTRAAIVAGNYDDAEVQAERAIASGESKPSATLLLAALRLRKGDFNGAELLLTPLLTSSPSRDGYLLRGLALACQSKPEAATDFQSAKALTALGEQLGFEVLFPCVRPQIEANLTALKNALPDLGKGSATAKASATQVQTIAEALAETLRMVSMDEKFRKISERTALSCDLLAQAANEALVAFGTSNQDGFSESRIDLEDAFNQFEASKTLLAQLTH